MEAGSSSLSYSFRVILPLYTLQILFEGSKRTFKVLLEGAPRVFKETGL